ncbi:MAG: hypothetical protein IT304_08970 [Dehalococcoidia bacterium]|nr:hypothetical protein [Dehalococcoidia bacterium]
MWKALITLERSNDPVEIVSPQEITVRMLLESGWVVFTGEFDTVGYPIETVAAFRIFQMGDAIA